MFGDGPFVYESPEGDRYEVFIDDDSLRIVFRDALGLSERVVLEGAPGDVMPLLQMARSGEFGDAISDVGSLRGLFDGFADMLDDIASDVTTLADKGMRVGAQVNCARISAMAMELGSMAVECRAHGDAIRSGVGELMLDSVMTAESFVAQMTDKALELNDAVVRLN